MLLGDRYFLNLEIEDRAYKLKYNFKFLKNLYRMTDKGPMEVLEGFLEKQDDTTLKIIMCCMCDELTFQDLNNVLNEEIRTSILLGIIKLIQECSIEYKESTKLDNEKNKNGFDFEEWWNYWYFVSTSILNKSEEEFLNSNLTEISILEKQNMKYKKAILISAYVDVLEAKNTTDKEKIKNNKTKKNVRLRDFL